MSVNKATPMCRKISRLVFRIVKCEDLDTEGRLIALRNKATNLGLGILGGLGAPGD